MKKVKNFIYVTGTEYFQKTITLDKTSVRTTNVIFDLNKSKGLTKLNQKREIKKEMKKVVSDNDVVVSSTEFSNGDVIITAGGIVLGNKLPSSIMSKAATKKDKRKKEISSYFKPGAYLSSCRSEYDTNFEFIDDVLLDLYKELLVNEHEVDTDTYLTLLDCLIEAPQPIKSSSYESNIEKVQKEYGRILIKTYRENNKEENAN